MSLGSNSILPNVRKFFCQGKWVEFKVRSDFGHATAKIAARTCLERMYESLNQLGVKIP